MKKTTTTQKLKAGSMVFGLQQSIKNQRTYWRLRWSDAGRRQEKTFSSEDGARAYARSLARSLQSGGMVLNPIQARIWEVINSECPPGQDILDIWSKGLELVKAEIIRHSTPQMDVCDSLDLWLASVEADHNRNSVGHHYLRTVRQYSKIVRKGFPCRVSDLNQDVIQEWFDCLDLAPKTKHNLKGYFCTWLKFCRIQGISNLEFSPRLPRLKKAPVVIFSPEEFRVILNAWPKERLPALVIGAFTGMRTEEISRLYWKDFHDGWIFLSEEITKKSISRKVPILPVLQAWLDFCGYQKLTGLVMVPRLKSPDTFFSVSSRVAKVKWRKNALRHSFCSYRLAITENASQVALEAGHDARELLGTYQKPVSPQVAEKWFSLFPEQILLK